MSFLILIAMEYMDLKVPFTWSALHGKELRDDILHCIRVNLIVFVYEKFV